MLQKSINHEICLKEYIDEKDYSEIKSLYELCTSQDNVNLKLGLNYKLDTPKKPDGAIKNINEFFYYVDGILIGYIGISCFGRNIGELNGMIHPKWRRKRIFNKLFELAAEECVKRKFYKILLLSDGKSNSGGDFIKAVGGKYDFSEYRMRRESKISPERIEVISLRKAGKSDGKEIARQNSIYFNDEKEEDSFKEDESMTESSYIIEFEGDTIGKINIEFSEDYAFICGFGILPDFRGKGYGKAALKEALHLINEKNIYTVELDVECKNNTALNLYKDCEFEEQSIMNYYKYNPQNN
ncbi:GNAT family N-acetyltransferase [Clostridium sp. C2-6-12]|uniref:GNAT family N-acetyltransferase n=1 Tax=Clostridium sp. C2-6-12 TaxID=2698832 RepID=UPI00136FF207|nr:GNAT family N-acetyltransferase [Clostridium sp. C2-6-12]